MVACIKYDKSSIMLQLRMKLSSSLPKSQFRQGRLSFLIFEGEIDLGCIMAAVN